MAVAMVVKILLKLSTSLIRPKNVWKGVHCTGIFYPGRVNTLQLKWFYFLHTKPDFSSTKL